MSDRKPSRVCEILKVANQTPGILTEWDKFNPWMKVGWASWLFFKSEILKIKNFKYRRNLDDTGCLPGK